jgi:hypothetical protein
MKKSKTYLDAILIPYILIPLYLKTCIEVAELWYLRQRLFDNLRPLTFDFGLWSIQPWAFQIILLLFLNPQ